MKEHNAKEHFKKNKTYMEIFSKVIYHKVQITMLWEVCEDPSLVCPTLKYFMMSSWGWFDNLVW